MLKKTFIVFVVVVNLFLLLLGSSIAAGRYKIELLNRSNQHAYNDIQTRVNQHELQAEIAKEQYGLSYITIKFVGDKG